MRLRSALPAAALATLLLVGGCQGSTATGSEGVEGPDAADPGEETQQIAPNTGREDDPTLLQDPDVGGADGDTSGAENFQGEDEGAPGG